MKATIQLPLFALMLLGFSGNAQQITNIYSFTNGSGGGNPLCGVISSGNRLYGMTSTGSTNSKGAIFAVNADGTGFTSLHAFSAAATNGTAPEAGLLLLGNTLLGTTQLGGTNGNGTVFALTTNGTGFTLLHAFGALVGNNNTNSDGAYPSASLTGSGNTLFGTAYTGGTNGNGTVFAIGTGGTGFTVLHTFSATAGNNATNSDGGSPSANLVLSGNTLYGTAYGGGTNGTGTVFALNAAGTGFTVLHTFGAELGDNYTNSDGGNPYYGGLVLLGSTLYGTAVGGGANGYGTVFAVNTDGTGYTVLHTFSATAGNNLTNSDGALPYFGLMLVGNTLYGTTISGGTQGGGTVFAVNTDGKKFTTMASFSRYTAAYGSLILSGTTLIGATSGDGTGFGTLFGFSPPPPHVSIASVGNQAVIFYPSTGINYTLQTTTDVNSGPWVAVTNGVPITGTAVSNSLPAAFFRLQ